MDTMDVKLNETVNVSVDNDLGESSPGVELDEEIVRGIYASTWSALEEKLVEANAAYNGNVEGDQWDRVRALSESLSAASNYAEVLVTLTAVPVPDTPEEES